ncbi:MAG: SAM-dependent chlorinase/fluorinase [Solirubrobacteraceae bacterium MAG38_C4-C5]|nr:SAM-dependent chlorinase/fluorinase [Candidatus Siliceabacter maunaloa]
MPVVTFLSDYGVADDFVGVCHGVVLGICPHARIVDITHGIARHDVRAGALTLRRSLPYMPAGVHLAVVDPEVGAQRRAVALRTADEDRLLVGPDNGLLSLAAARFGGAVEAVDIGRSQHRLEPVSATFHGRDLFAPVAAHLSAGAPLAEAGAPLDPDQLVRLEHDLMTVHVLGTDRFGNVTLDAEHEELTAAGLRLGTRVAVEVRGRTLEATYAGTFADVDEDGLVLYEDTYRTLSLAVNRGSAAAALAVGLDAELLIRPLT